MTIAAAPQLRRSKRKQNEQAANTDPTTANDDAPATRKRARKVNPSATKRSFIDASASQKHDHCKVNEPITDTIPVRSQQHEQTLSPFLSLPRELRDEIYRHVLEQDKSPTLKSGSRNRVTRCGLVGVNNQISEEFLDAVLFYAPVITTTVCNHNFAHIVTFLNRLSEAQLAKLSTHGPGVAQADDAKPKRKIRILLSYSGRALDIRVHLHRWLNRFDSPDKRGKEIEFEYAGDGTYENRGYKQKSKVRASASERWNEEAAKIREAAHIGGRVFDAWRCYGLY